MKRFVLLAVSLVIFLVVLGGSASAAPVLPTVRYEQQKTTIFSYGGAWITSSSAYASAGSFRYLNSTGSATIKFSGIQAALIAKKSPVYGKARVYLDGKYAGLIDLYSAKTLWKQKVWTTPLLRDGAHTVKIEWTGVANARATGKNIGIDAVDVSTKRTLRFLPYGDSKTSGAGEDPFSGGYPTMLETKADTRYTNWKGLARIAFGGQTPAQMLAHLDSDLAGRTTAPDVILINLGTNWPGYFTEQTYVRPVVGIVDKLHAKWPKAQIYLARIWHPWNVLTDTVDNVYVPWVVSGRPRFVHLGIDERTFLPGVANSMMCPDGVHPDHDGYSMTASEWAKVLGRAFE